MILVFRLPIFSLVSLSRPSLVSIRRRIPRKRDKRIVHIIRGTQVQIRLPQSKITSSSAARALFGVVVLGDICKRSEKTDATCRDPGIHFSQMVLG